MENPTYVMQEPRGIGQEGRALEIVHVVQEVLGVLIALRRRQREPVGGSILVLSDILSKKVQLTEGVLRELVSLLCRGGKLPDSLFDVFRDAVALEQEFSLLVLGKLVPQRCRFLEPPAGGSGVSGLIRIKFSFCSNGAKCRLFLPISPNGTQRNRPTAGL